MNWIWWCLTIAGIGFLFLEFQQNLVRSLLRVRDRFPEFIHIRKAIQKICDEAANMHRGFKVPFSQYRWWYKLYLLYCWCIRSLFRSIDRTRWSTIRFVLFILVLFGAGIYGEVLFNPLKTDLGTPYVYVAIGEYLFIYILGMELFVKGDDRYSRPLMCIAGLFIAKYSYACYGKRADEVKVQNSVLNLLVGAYIGGMISVSITTESLVRIAYAVPGALMWASLGIIISNLSPSCVTAYNRKRNWFVWMGADFGGPH